MNVNTKPEFKITLTDKYISIEEGNPNFDDILTTCLNAILTNAHAVVKHYSESEDEDVKAQTDVARGALFDEMNLAFSNALHIFDPEVDLHPELDEEQMLEEENAKLDKALADKDTEAFKDLMEGDETSYEEIQKLS